jgi:hypothetical protein
MRFRTGVLAPVLVLGLAFTSLAQEPPKEEPPKETPPAEAPAKEAPPAEAPVKEVSPAEAPAKDAVPAPEVAKPAAAAAAPAVAAKPAAPAASKEVSACAQSLQPLADSYKAAYEDMQKWIAEVDAQTSAANQGVAKLQAEVQANEDAATKAKLAGDNAKVKDLAKQNKQLWSQLEAAKKSAAVACAPVSKQAADRVKQYEAATAQALAKTKSK